MCVSVTLVDRCFFIFFSFIISIILLFLGLSGCACVRAYVHFLPRCWCVRIVGRSIGRNECAIYVIAMNGQASVKLKTWKENVREQSRRKHRPNTVKLDTLYIEYKHIVVVVVKHVRWFSSNFTFSRYFISSFFPPQICFFFFFFIRISYAFSLLFSDTFSLFFVVYCCN